MGRLSPNNHGAIPLIFTLSPFSTPLFFRPFPFPPLSFLYTPPFGYSPYQYCYDSATCDLTCAMCIVSYQLATSPDLHSNEKQQNVDEWKTASTQA